MNLASIIDNHPDDAVALVSRGKETTYGSLRSQVAALRGGFGSLGLGPGDRLGIACGNNWYFVVSYLAALGAGLIAVPLNPAAPAPELQQELATTGVKALVVLSAAVPAVSGLDRSALPDLSVVIATAGADLPDAEDLDDLLTSAPAPMVDRADTDLAVLMFTSGTAGSPRAAMLTHGNLRANLEQIESVALHQDGQDAVFCVLPLFHIFGLNVALGLTLHVGAKIVLVERFDPDSALETIQRHHITVVSGAPTMWAAWANLPGADPRAFESVRIAASGAAKLPVETAQLIEDRFAVHLDEGYGLTETSPVVASSAGTGAPWGSIGVPVPGVEIRIVDAEGADVLEHDPGELWVRGPNVFEGYWNDKAASANALTPDGWLRTGDVALADEDGYLFLVDRAKDLIIVSGFNVYPAEVEDVLIEHPAVAAVAVVGVPHPYSGEAVKAFVVVEDGRTAEEDDIIAWCTDRLARYKCPNKVMFVDELPRNITGKILRRALE